jgi:hypothetical protein
MATARPPIGRHVRPDYSGTTLALDGPEAMKTFGNGMREQLPGFGFNVRRALSEGALVLLHSSGVLVPGTPLECRTGRSPSSGTPSTEPGVDATWSGLSRRSQMAVTCARDNPCGPDRTGPLRTGPTGLPRATGST